MNTRIEKLSLPRRRRDPIFKFWQPNAKLEKIHPPVHWKALDYRQKSTTIKHLSKANDRNRCEGSSSNACHYTTLTYKNASEKGFHVFVDYEHHDSQHTHWRESIEGKDCSNEKIQIKAQPSLVDFPWVSSTIEQQSRNDHYSKRQDFTRYFQSHIPKDNLFQLDRTAYPNRPKPMSRRPRDVLHVDFYQATCFEGSKTEATFKTFYHRKYLLPRHLREYNLQDLLTNSPDVELHIDIIGHFILHPNELSNHEIKMFELTSDFGDIYEGHIIRINEEKLVLLLASAHHSDIKLARSKDMKDIIEKAAHLQTQTDSFSVIEQLVVDHVRNYFQSNRDYSVEQIRRLEMEFEPLIDQEKRRLIVHLFTDEELITSLSFDITYEQEPNLFRTDDENNLYFLQTKEEKSTIDSVEQKLKELFDQRYARSHQEENSYIQSTLDIEYDAIHRLEKLLHAYAHRTLTSHSREECMRIAIEYSFDDLLDTLDAEEVESNSEQKIQMIIVDVQMRLRCQIERRLKAEETAKVLLEGPLTKKEMESTGKEVMVLDHHREIFINRSNTSLGSPKMKDIQRNTGKVMLHEQIEGGPKSFDRLPMSIDSLTILARSQQRQHLAIEQNDNQLILLGSGIHRLMTSEDQEERHRFSIKCEQDEMPSFYLDESLSLDQNESSSMKTLNTQSYNTSADTKQSNSKQFKRIIPRKKKRLSRSPAEYGRHKHKRRKQPRYELKSKLCLHRSQRKCSFLQTLVLLHGNPKRKIEVLMTNLHQKKDPLDENRNAWKTIRALIKQCLSSRNIKMKSKEALKLKKVISSNENIMNRTNEKDQKCNSFYESIDEQLFHNEGFEDKETSAKSLDDTEGYLHSLYGSLSSAMKHVYAMYQSESSRLISSLNLAHIFITFLHLRKDIAHEIASTIIHSRQSLVRSISAQKTSSNATIDHSIISDGSSGEKSRATLSNRSTDIDEENKSFSNTVGRERSLPYKHGTSYSSNAQHSMSRIIAYLSETDWRVFNYITKHFLQNGDIITSHALEFSSVLLLDLIEDTVYQMYFHFNFTLNHTKEDLSIENTLMEEFLKKSIDCLFHRLQLINLPLLESIALMHTLKEYLATDLLRQFYSKTCHPVPLGRDPGIWFSIDILIKTICSLTDDIFHQMNQDYLSDYTKFEYLLVSYFRQIQVVRHLQDAVQKNRTRPMRHVQCLLHVIDLNQAPKFFSDQAFKRFKVGEHNQMNGDVEGLKDLVLLDMRKRKARSVERPYIPLSIDNLVRHEHNRVVSPSPWIIAQCQRRLGTRNIPSEDENMRKDSYSLDSTGPSHLPPEVRVLLENMIRKYGTTEENLSMQTARNVYEGLSEEEIAQLIENAIEAVEKFDRDNNIGDRKLQNRQAVNDRLMEFFKHAGRHGVRVLDDILKLAKLRSNDPKKYVPLAVKMLKDRLKQARPTRTKTQTVRFAHTLETLFATANDEPELMAMLLEKKSEEKTSVRNEQEEVNQKFDTSLIKPVDGENLPFHPEKTPTEDRPQSVLSPIDKTKKSTLALSDMPMVRNEFPSGVFMPTSCDSRCGLTVAQLIVLIIGQTNEPLKLTDSQIEQICQNQGFDLKQLIVSMKNLKELPNEFKLTEEQLIQITMEENISITDVQRIGTSANTYHLTKNQIQCLMAQLNMLNYTPSTSRVLSEQTSRPLALHLYQLIEISHQQKIDIDQLLADETTLQYLSSVDNSETKFILSSLQIAHLIKQNNFDIPKLMDIEHNLQELNTQDRQFHLTSPQLAYLFSNRRTHHDREVVGLSISQLIGLYALQEQSTEDDQTPPFFLTYDQIKQIALMQGMSLEYFHSLPTAKKSFELTIKQLIHIVVENQVSMEQIIGLHNDQKCKQLDREQLCVLINQNDLQHTMRQSMEKLLAIRQRVYLTVEQIFSLANHSNIHLDEMVTCSAENSDMADFRFKPTQLVTLCNRHDLNDIHNQARSLSGSLPQFILSDEQFSSLLHSVPTSTLSRHRKLSELNSESIVLSVSTPSNHLNTQLARPLADEFMSMRERLKSSIRGHAEVVKIVSNSLLERNRLENALNVVHQSSLHAIDDISTKEVETIPSFVLDLLGMNPMTESTYQSIRQGEIDSNVLDNDPQSKQTVGRSASGNLTKDIIEEIRAHRLTLPQIHQIQTQFLTPKLINQFKSGHLSQRIFDAYKSQSSLQLINKVRSSAAQLNALRSEQLFGSSALKMQKTATEKETLAVQHTYVLPHENHQDPIIIYPESTILRQQILQELGDRLDTQLLELKKEYGIEPTKGQASIRQITNKLRAMAEVEDLPSVLGRPVDEVDILNLVHGHFNHLFDRGQIDPQNTIELLARNTQYRSDRVNERIQLVHILKSDIENKLLKRPMTLEEFNALVLEDIPRFEWLSSIQLTDDDARIISMNRFASLERSLTRQLIEAEYRHLLQTDLPFNYIEQELLKRSLTEEERLEQETLTFLPYQDFFVDQSSWSRRRITESLEEQNLKLSDTQLEQILRKRAELVDQYEILHSISPSIKRIEEQLDRSLTIDEKKRLTDDDYSIIQSIKHRADEDMQDQTSPTTPSLLPLAGKTHDQNGIETSLKRSSTKDEIPIITSENVINLEEPIRQSMPTERELKDGFFPDNPHAQNPEREKNSFIFDLIPREAIQFTLSEIEKVLERAFNTAELERFAGTRFSHIEDDLSRSLNDQERSNLLRGDQLAVETLITRKLSPEETGPHIVNITEIENILNRSLTLDELNKLAGDRFDEIVKILGRMLTREELIELLNGNYDTMIQVIKGELNQRKEIELKELPIIRLHYFEKILHRKLSSYELLRFAEDRFQTISRLLTNPLKSEQIRDLSSGRYENIQTFLKRSLTPHERYQLQKSLFEAHMKYPNVLEELEYIIQRRLNERELRTLTNNQYDHIERHLKRSLTEKQVRNLLQGKDDSSLSEVEDLVRFFRGKYDDNSKRTQTIATRLIEELERDYSQHHKKSSATNILQPSSHSPSTQHERSDLDFHQSTMNLLEQLSDDGRKHAIVTSASEVESEDGSKGQDRPLSPDEEKIPISLSHELLLPEIDQNEPIKAFENIPRVVEQIAAEERLEEMTTVTNAINQFQEKYSQKMNRTTSEWLSDLHKDLESSELSVTKSLPDQQLHPKSSLTAVEDLYLGWTLFKSVDRPELGLKDEKPRVIHVKHMAQTYVVGIPEEYADDKFRIIANKIYQGEVIRYRQPSSRTLQTMSELVSQLIKIPIINDATHFIVPSRAYMDIIETMNTYKSDLLDVEDDESHTLDSPETLEWYEECIQRNVQVHAQIPVGYQPSIVYCHTGRRTVITPARRSEQRKASIANAMEKSKTRTPQDSSPLVKDFIGRFSQSMFDSPSTTTPSSTMGTVTDLIMHTIATSQKTDLLEALEELFSQDNLEKYQITETHWQDIFLILLNSYLRSRSTNRKEIFKQLTDKLHELRRKDRRRSSGFYPSISVTSPPALQTRDSNKESDTTETKQKQFHFGLRSSMDSLVSGRSPNDSEYSTTPATIDQNNAVLPSQSLSRNQSAMPTMNSSPRDLVGKRSFHFPSKSNQIGISGTSSEIPQNRSTNSNAIPNHQISTNSSKHRRYIITVLHSDEPFNIPSNECQAATESVKLPPIVIPKSTSSQAKQVASAVSLADQLPRVSSTTKRTRPKRFF